MDSAWNTRMPRFGGYWSAMTVRILTKAIEVIGSPERYVTGTLAVDSSGRPVGPRSRWARCWSTLGAISRAALYCGSPRSNHDDAEFEIYSVAGDLSFKHKPENWSFDQAHTALLWACERWNYVPTDIILDRVFADIFMTRANFAANVEHLIRNRGLLARIQSEWGALNDYVGDVTLGLGGEMDDHYRAEHWLCQTAESMGYECASTLCHEAPLTTVHDMILWTIEESRFLRLYGYRSEQTAI